MIDSVPNAGLGSSSSRLIAWFLIQFSKALVTCSVISRNAIGYAAII